MFEYVYVKVVVKLTSAYSWVVSHVRNLIFSLTCGMLCYRGVIVAAVCVFASIFVVVPAYI